MVYALLSQEICNPSFCPKPPSLRQNSSLGLQKKAVNHVGKKVGTFNYIFHQLSSKTPERLRGRERGKVRQASCMQHCPALRIS